VLLAATIATLAALAFCLRPRASREAPTTLGEYSMLALAMLFLSERSWKHHWVLVALPFAFLISTFLDRGLRDPPGRTSVFAVTVAALLFGLTGSGVLGPHGSDLAEAYGAFLLGGLALFVACGRVLRSG
jgi:hypothetical protein